MSSLYLDNSIMDSLFHFSIFFYSNTANVMPIAYLVISN